MGAWIEIFNSGYDIVPIIASLPSWERGLKFFDLLHTIHTINVAPLVGAWIEIKRTVLLSCPCTVAPLVGAWIEI